MEEREFPCCPATVRVTKAATKPLLERVLNFGSGNLDSIENLKSKIGGREGAASRFEAQARRPIRSAQTFPFRGRRRVS